jgi:cystathionine gamma-synthase
MNAFWGAFRAVSEIQRSKGRDTWLQIGWLYLDTAAILAKFTGERHVRILNVTDRQAIEQAFQEHGSRLAGVVTEITTNPLMQTPDLEHLSNLARKNGAFMLVDPTISSPCNVDVLPYSDIVLNSLTKYAASEGDVIAGAVGIAPHCPDVENVRAAVADALEPLYARDAARLALEINGQEDLVAELNANARRVIEHLRNRKTGVKQLYWSQQEGSRENYLRLAGSPDRIGPVFSFQVEGSMERFYDAVSIAKGPSFGIRTSILMPYVYLAHYDLITSKEGRSLLAEAGLPADLMRLSVGAEPAEATIEALEKAFAAAGFA